MSQAQVTITKRGAERARGGHLWIYRSDVRDEGGAPGGSVVRVRDERGLLVVTDQGPGIPAEHRERAFARFWRAPAARALPGSGLGLAIVADTVRAHGGRVWFADPPPGWGACVHIELPRDSRKADP